MNLEVGMEVAIWRRGILDSVGKVDRVTPKRAYADGHELVREFQEGRDIKVIGQSEWSYRYATIATDKDRLLVAKRQLIRAARRYFERLIDSDNVNDMLDAYSKLVPKP